MVEESGNNRAEFSPNASTYESLRMLCDQLIGAIPEDRKKGVSEMMEVVTKVIAKTVDETSVQMAKADTSLLLYLRDSLLSIGFEAVASVLEYVGGKCSTAERLNAVLEARAGSAVIFQDSLADLEKIALSTFEISYLRGKTKYLLEHGGLDTLMEGYVSLKTEIGQHRMKELITEAVDRMEQEGIGASLAYADIDRFKSVNETLGHSPADIILSHVAAVVKKELAGRRGDNIFVRDGGEEIAVVMLNRQGSVVASALENTREAVQKSSVYMLYPYLGDTEEASRNELERASEVTKLSDERVAKLGLSQEHFTGVDVFETEGKERLKVAERYVVDDPRNRGRKMVIRKVNVTVSMGLVDFGERNKGESALDYFSRMKAQADTQTKKAKEGGRNQIFYRGERLES